LDETRAKLTVWEYKAAGLSNQCRCRIARRPGRLWSAARPTGHRPASSLGRFSNSTPCRPRSRPVARRTVRRDLEGIARSMRRSPAQDLPAKTLVALRTRSQTLRPN